MTDFIIGAGQGGSRLAKTFSDTFMVPAIYLNLAGVDFQYLDVPKEDTFLIEAGGTGRDPEVGEEIAFMNRAKIEEFIYTRMPNTCERVLVTVGGGGGSGSGMVYTILNLLIKEKIDVVLVFTIPQRTEGIPAKPNALKTLNRLIGKYLVKQKIGLLCIDNDFCIERYGTGNSSGDMTYWGNVNLGLSRSLLKFWYLTNLPRFANWVDVNSGFGALDEKEFLRILYMKGGFLDLREFSCKQPSFEEVDNAKFRSLVFGNLDIATTKEYIVTVGFPERLRGDSRVPEFTEAIFNKLSRLTKTAFVLRSSYFNKKLSEIRVSVLMAGLIKSHGLKKITNQTVKDVAKYQAKGGIEKLDLTGLDF